MYATNTYYIPSDVCHHTPVDDEQSGECVCVTCGKVLETLYGSNIESFLPKSHKKIHFVIEEFIRDIYDRGHIAGGTLSQSISLYYRLAATHNNNKKALACYAIYVTLSAAEVPRSLDEISVYSGISKDAIWNMQKRDTPPENSVVDCVENYVERVCADLKISFRDTFTIKQIVQKLSGECGVRANTLIGAVIYLYCNEKRIPVIVKKIAVGCNVTTSSIYKYVKKFDKKFVKSISMVLN
jgi:transcription initiation factor TFIIIB Brf1 subunit/transcription initiation factor TFIIB